MPGYQPDVFQEADRSNVHGREKFLLKVVYGSGAIASARGRYLLLEDTATGKMTVKFPRTYARVRLGSWMWTKCAAGAVLFPVVLTDSIATEGSHGGGSLVVETRTEAGTATDPASGDELTLEFVVENDAANEGDDITVTTP